MATFSYSSSSWGALQSMLTGVLTNTSDRVISSTSTRIDYGDNPMRDPYTQFFGIGMNGTTTAGVVTDIDIYWPNSGSLSYIMDGMPQVPLADLFNVGNTAHPLDALNHILARADWTGYGTGYDESFDGFYSAESIHAGGGDDYYTASMARGQARNIVDRFDGGDGNDSVSFLDMPVGVTVDLAAGTVVFNEAVNGAIFSRTLQMVNVEEFTASNRADQISGTNGNDQLYAAGGNDTVRGLKGSDDLFGHGGADFLDGGKGQDWLSGGKGKDVLLGRGGNDKLDGDKGADVLRGAKGRDTLDGGGGRDKLYAGGGKDKLQGGDDRMDGGNGNDVMRGDMGSDTLRGGNGADRIGGGRGNDHIYGDKGNDTLTGGKGKDVFVFKTKGNTGSDEITDFQVKNDLLDLRGGNTKTDIFHDGADTVIDYAGGMIRLLDVHLNENQYDVII